MSTPGRVQIPRSEMVECLSTLVVEQMRAAIESRGRCHIALPGGSAAKILYAGFAKALLPWDKVHLYWGDERAVPLDHQESNYHLAHELWLKSGTVPAENIHPMRAERARLEECAEQYEQMLRSQLMGLSGLDVVVVGVGPDGHVCSLFPHHPLLSEQSRWVAPVYDSPKPPLHRLTLTFPVLEQAGHVFVVAYGEEKANVITSASSGNTALPLGVLLARCPRVTLVLDDAAGAGGGGSSAT